MELDPDSADMETQMESMDPFRPETNAVDSGRVSIEGKGEPVMTRSELRQLEVIRKLEEKNKSRAAERERERAKEVNFKEKVRAAALGGNQGQITSRLLQPKKKVSNLDERTEEAETATVRKEMQKMIKKVQSQGPDPRHAAFLEKLAEQKRIREQEDKDKEEKERKRKLAVAAAARLVSLKGTRKDDKDNEGKDSDEGNESKETSSSVVPAVWKKHKDSVENDKQTRFEQDRNLDRARWAQKHGILESTPVFICSNGYPAVKEELLRRGWFENKDRESDIWDLYFSMKMTPFMNKTLREEQMVNRFFGTGEICSKAGISKNLKSVKWFETEDPDSFFPRCYNLGTSDGTEYEDFVDDFRVTAVERLLKFLRLRLRCGSCSGSVLDCNGCEQKRSEPIQGSPFLLQSAVRVCNRFMNKFNDDYVDSPSSFVAPAVTIVEWSVMKDATSDLTISTSILSRFRQFARSGNIEKILTLFKDSIEQDGLLIGSNDSMEASEREARELEVKRHAVHQIKRMIAADEEGKLEKQDIELPLLEKALQTLASLEEYRGPQGKINGDVGKNVWIVKPAGKSRGRGIQCFDNLEKLQKYTRVNAQETTKWVVQKYMENSLIVHKRKFDIRQWVLVTNWNPLTIYFFDDCYLRFCVEEYSLEDLEDRFIHLANNSISKYSEKFHSSPIEENMWRKDAFIQYMDQIGVPGGGSAMWQEKIKPALQNIVRMSMSCVQDLIQNRTNSFEIFGFDFMIDENFNPWLIEINSSPSMEYSTKVTAELAKSALTSAVACVLDAKYKSLPNGKRKVRSKPLEGNVDTGNWEILYVSPHEFRRKLDLLELSVNGSGIESYNKGESKRLRIKRRTLSFPSERDGKEFKSENDEEKM